MIDNSTQVQIKQAIQHVLAECYVTDPEGFLTFVTVDGLSRRHIELLDIDVHEMAIKARHDVDDGSYLYYQEHKELFNTMDVIQKLLKVIDKAMSDIKEKAEYENN